MLNVAEAAKAIGVTRQQLYNVIYGRSAVMPEMAVRFANFRRVTGVTPGRFRRSLP